MTGQTGPWVSPPPCGHGLKTLRAKDLLPRSLQKET